MKIYSVYDKEFNMYGRVINDDFSDIVEALKQTPLPEKGVIYCPSDKTLESCPSYKSIINDYYGNMNVQLGYCNGYNDTLNALEYHLDSEINLSDNEFILILGLRQQIENGKFDTSLCKAFKVPAGVPVEVYATSLHYAPTRENNLPYKVLIALPRGTNVKAESSNKDKMLFATNKWLLAHPDSSEAKGGAYIGLTGENLKL